MSAPEIKFSQSEQTILEASLENLKARLGAATKDANRWKIDTDFKTKAEDGKVKLEIVVTHNSKVMTFSIEKSYLDKFAGDNALLARTLATEIFNDMVLDNLASSFRDKLDKMLVSVASLEQKRTKK